MILSYITLKCNGVKKLLPYHGFYPSHRTLQVASLFSQSIAPYIGGVSWSAGEATDLSSPPSGALAVQSLLQPYYAPGIIYNTIKAGIACDWAAYTGSAVMTGSGEGNNGFLSIPGNYRIPFESVLDPLSNVGIPASSSNGEGKLNLLYPTYAAKTEISSWAQSHLSLPRAPYVDLENLQRARAKSSTKYNQYRLAINNFLAEIPSFFLKDNELKTIVSKPAGEVSMTEGTTYYMNVYLEKDPNILMIQDYWNGLRTGGASVSPSAYPLTDDTSYRSFNGRYFGPPVLAGTESVAPSLNGWGPDQTTMGDPAYAPYTPPYFYGKSISTIAYTADANDALDGGFNYKKIFEKATVTQTNPTMEGMFTLLDADLTSAPALSGAMGLSASLNLFGLFAEKEATMDDAGNLTAVTNKPDSNRNKWVISPRMETPILDFSDQPEQRGWGRGMWSGYGNVSNSSDGITFGIEETDFGPTTHNCGPKMFWESLVDVTVDYDSQDHATIVKTGINPGWNAGAAGGNPVELGGFWQYTIDQKSDNILCGLNTDAPALTTYTDMQYGIQTREYNYQQCGWTNLSNCAVSSVVGTNSTLTKNGGFSTGDACAFTTDPIERGGFWEFECDLTSPSSAPLGQFGLSTTDGAAVFCLVTNRPAWHIYLKADGNIDVYESAVLIASDVETWDTGEKFRVYISAAHEVRYYKYNTSSQNWDLFYTSPSTVTPSTDYWGYAKIWQYDNPPIGQLILTTQGNPGNGLVVYESGKDLGSKGSYEVGDQIRLALATTGEMLYQHSTGSNNVFKTIYSSTTSSLGNSYRADITIYETAASVSEAFQYPDECTTEVGSLIERCFNSGPEDKQIGEIATQKIISEAIVAIPFTTECVEAGSNFAASTRKIIDKHFIAIEQAKFDVIRSWYIKTKNLEDKFSPRFPSVSMQKMVTLMDKYIIPPELDFLTFASGNQKVDPFVMYLFEFNHTLDAQDLADIWQGVMPDIARVAKLSDPGIDENVFTHPTGPDEFFHDKHIPSDIRWMVFKVKRKANWNYYAMTADTQDDKKFDFKFNIGGVELPYSYNWPYDYFSLVELAEIEAGNNFAKKDGLAITEVEETLTPLGEEIQAKNLKIGPTGQVGADVAASLSLRGLDNTGNKGGSSGGGGGFSTG